MEWQGSRVSAEGSHHEREGRPMYAGRFDDVLSFHPPGVAAVRLGESAWHIDADGKAIYSTTFQRTFGFYDGLAAVIAADGWYHIDLHGNPVYPGRLAWCGNFQGGRCTVRDDSGHYFHINANGVPLYPQRWRYAGDYRDGVAVVQRDDGQSSHVDERGKFLHDKWFIDLDVFHKGLARARDSDGWAHVDRAGQVAYTRRFAAVEPFYNGQARVERFDGGLEVVGQTGLSVVELRTGIAPQQFQR